jgi:hypothetical protein
MVREILIADGFGEVDAPGRDGRAGMQTSPLSCGCIMMRVKVML